MRFFSLALLMLSACGIPDPTLGGQEGEPYPAAPPEAEHLEPDDDAAVTPVPPPSPAGNAPCEIAAHCMGDGWCAEYSDQTVPDLALECPGHWDVGPCSTYEAVGTCPTGPDACTVVWLYDERADDVCSL